MDFSGEFYRFEAPTWEEGMAELDDFFGPTTPPQSPPPQDSTLGGAVGQDQNLDSLEALFPSHSEDGFGEIGEAPQTDISDTGAQDEGPPVGDYDNDPFEESVERDVDSQAQEGIDGDFKYQSPEDTDMYSASPPTQVPPEAGSVTEMPVDTGMPQAPMLLGSGVAEHQYGEAQLDAPPSFAAPGFDGFGLNEYPIRTGTPQLGSTGGRNEDEFVGLLDDLEHFEDPHGLVGAGRLNDDFAVQMQRGPQAQIYAPRPQSAQPSLPSSPPPYSPELPHQLGPNHAAGAPQLTPVPPSSSTKSFMQSEMHDEDEEAQGGTSKRIAPISFPSLAAGQGASPVRPPVETAPAPARFSPQFQGPPMLGGFDQGQMVFGRTMPGWSNQLPTSERRSAPMYQGPGQYAAIQPNPLNIAMPPNFQKGFTGNAMQHASPGSLQQQANPLMPVAMPRPVTLPALGNAPLANPPPSRRLSSAQTSQKQTGGTKPKAKARKISSPLAQSSPAQRKTSDTTEQANTPEKKNSTPKRRLSSFSMNIGNYDPASPDRPTNFPPELDEHPNPQGYIASQSPKNAYSKKPKRKSSLAKRLASNFAEELEDEEAASPQPPPMETKVPAKRARADSDTELTPKPEKKARRVRDSVGDRELKGLNGMVSDAVTNEMKKKKPSPRKTRAQKEAEAKAAPNASAAVKRRRTGGEAK